MAHIRVRPTALIIKNDAVLLIEYSNNGIYFNLPGGGAEPGETLLEALKREAREEACVDIDVGPLALIFEFAPHKQSGNYDPNGKHGLHLIFDCTLKEGSRPRMPDNPDPHQTAVRWVKITELDHILLIPNIQEQIAAYIKDRRGIALIEDHQLKPLSIMNTIPVYHYDAFSTVPDKGNPAGVVFDADSLTNEQMQHIAHKVGFNETVFVQSSSIADLKLRYFTPGHEMSLCGHATMVALYGLRTRGILDDKALVHIETNVGVLSVQFTEEDGQLHMEMQQDHPQFVPFEGDVERLAQSIGLTIHDLDRTKPIVYGSTGTWTLLIPIKQLAAFKRMKPNNPMFPDLLAENPRASVHPFCLEAHDEQALMHARHFSSPYSGTIEDPVTGTASGVMGAYYLTYLDKDAREVEFIVEQGQEIGRDGRVGVKVKRQDGDMAVSIAGTAVFVKEMSVLYF